MKPQRDGQKKRKQTLTEGDEPESKMNKTDAEGAGTDKGTVVTICSDHCIRWSAAISFSLCLTCACLIVFD